MCDTSTVNTSTTVTYVPAQGKVLKLLGGGDNQPIISETRQSQATKTQSGELNATQTSDVHWNFDVNMEVSINK